MNTRETVQAYFAALEKKQGWEALLDEQVTFTSFTSPVREISGIAALVEGTKRFYSSISSFELRQLIVEGEKGCAFTRYQLQGPAGPFTSDVAEVFAVRGGKIQSFGIYFDTAPFPK
jgi:ketosteroid isomerase-like protein